MHHHHSVRLGTVAVAGSSPTVVSGLKHWFQSKPQCGCMGKLLCGGGIPYCNIICFLLLQRLQVK